jgi:type I restriction enzyme S subunit
MKNMRVAIAPEEEQNRIVAKVDELMILCDQLKTSLHDAQVTQHLLSDVVVDKALA